VCLAEALHTEPGRSKMLLAFRGREFEPRRQSYTLTRATSCPETNWTTPGIGDNIYSLLWGVFNARHATSRRILEPWAFALFVAEAGMTHSRASLAVPSGPDVVADLIERHDRTKPRRVHAKKGRAPVKKSDNRVR
jgi:hypothetical protein